MNRRTFIAAFGGVVGAGEKGRFRCPLLSVGKVKSIDN